MTSTPSDPAPGDRVPPAGAEGAAGATTEGVDDAALESDGEGRPVLRRRERSGTGPGAGEEDIVSLEAGLQDPADPSPTRHPTLRGTQNRSES